MRQNFQTATDIVERLRCADAQELAVLERTVAADTRKTVQNALAAAKRRIAAEEAEAHRLAGMYSFQAELAKGAVCMGLDEVGRGPLAGPLTIGAVVLPDHPHIAGLNDSKQVSPAARCEIAQQVKQVALAWDIEHIEPADIDACGMAACLRMAFMRAIRAIDAQVPGVEAVLLDGNALHIDSREHNVIKGDGKCASIAAASIIAKVERDNLMVKFSETYPEYGFSDNKGYASAAHQQAIREYGLSPIHRVSFCSAFIQPTLF